MLQQNDDRPNCQTPKRPGGLAKHAGNFVELDLRSWTWLSHLAKMRVGCASCQTADVAARRSDGLAKVMRGRDQTSKEFVMHDHARFFDEHRELDAQALSEAERWRARCRRTVVVRDFWRRGKTKSIRKGGPIRGLLHAPGKIRGCVARQAAAALAVRREEARSRADARNLAAGSHFRSRASGQTAQAAHQARTARRSTSPR